VLVFVFELENLFVQYTFGVKKPCEEIVHDLYINRLRDHNVGSSRYLASGSYRKFAQRIIYD
jgi:hypothetical protein